MKIVNDPFEYLRTFQVTDAICQSCQAVLRVYPEDVEYQGISTTGGYEEKVRTEARFNWKCVVCGTLNSTHQWEYTAKANKKDRGLRQR